MEINVKEKEENKNAVVSMIFYACASALPRQK